MTKLERFTVTNMTIILRFDNTDSKENKMKRISQKQFKNEYIRITVGKPVRVMLMKNLQLGDIVWAGYQHKVCEVISTPVHKFGLTSMKTNDLN